MARIILRSATCLSFKVLLIIDVVLFGNPIQPINARIPAFQAFLQIRAGSHVLIAGPMPLAPTLADPFLDIQTIATLFLLLLLVQ